MPSEMIWSRDTHDINLPASEVRTIIFCSPCRTAASSRGPGRHYRHEGSPVSRHTPHSNEQLSHCGDDRNLARFACSPQPFIILPQPGVAPD